MRFSCGKIAVAFTVMPIKLQFISTQYAVNKAILLRRANALTKSYVLIINE